MRSLFIFLYRFRAFITLVILESFCAFLIVQNSQYHRALFFNSSNTVVGGILSTSNNINQYFSLKGVNETLSAENAKLKNDISGSASIADSIAYDSIRHFNYINARVINNSVDLRNNLLTLNVGSAHGVKYDMGVIANGSIVGKTRYVSTNYTVVTSVLHTESMIPATVKNKVNICTIQWDGTDPYFVDLLYVPRHYSLLEGDTVITSGYSGIFPPNIQIGAIHSISLSDDAQFFDIKVAESVSRPEIDSLEIIAQ